MPSVTISVKRGPARMIGRSAEVWFGRYGLRWIECGIEFGTTAGNVRASCIRPRISPARRPKNVAPKRQSLSFQTGLTMLSNP